MIVGAIIHPVWVIDEYAIIVLSRVWFNPNSPPIIAFIGAIINIIFLIETDKIGNKITINGAIFCHVVKIIQFLQDIDDITEGNQKWQGAAPNLISKDIISTIIIILLIISLHIIILNVIIIAEPSACDKKYFVLASTSWFNLEDIIIGINDRRFSSSAAHIINQFLEEIAMIVLISRVDNINIFLGIKYIRSWRN